MICVKVQYSVEGVTPIQHGGSVASVLAHLDSKMALISEVPNKRKVAIVIPSFLSQPLHFFILQSTCLFVTILTPSCATLFAPQQVAGTRSGLDRRISSQMSTSQKKRKKLKNSSYECVNSAACTLSRLQLLIFLFFLCAVCDL